METLEQQEVGTLENPGSGETAFVEDIVNQEAPELAQPEQGYVEPQQEGTISVDYEAESKKFQSMYDRAQADNTRLKQLEPLGQLLEQRPDIVQLIQNGIANPQGAQDSQPGMSNDDFNPWEAFTDDNSQSGQYVSGKIDAMVNQRVNSEMAKQQQQMQAEMAMNNTVSELRGTYKMSDNDIRDFLTFTTQPKEAVGLDNLVKLYKMQNGTSVENNDTMEAVSAARQAPRTAGVLQGQAPESPKSDQDKIWDTIMGSGSGTALP
jgi:hypothetical protein|tara:strand:+ start:2551 stop:3342 length:792 start_codon:yes stop_codon:yes gene_type:complete